MCTFSIERKNKLQEHLKVLQGDSMLVRLLIVLMMFKCHFFWFIDLWSCKSLVPIFFGFKVMLNASISFTYIFI